MYLDTRNKNFCYMLAAYPQSNRDRSLRHEMALSHERLMAKKRHMQMEVASARVFPEGPGESRARGRGPAETLTWSRPCSRCWRHLLVPAQPSASHPNGPHISLQPGGLHGDMTTLHNPLFVFFFQHDHQEGR